MPNHVTNILKIEGPKSEIDKCIRSIRKVEVEGGKEYVSHMDFNAIVPRPESLNITSGTNVDNAIAIISNDDKYFAKMLDYPWVRNEGLNTIDQIKEHFHSKLTQEDLKEASTALDNLKKYGHKDWYSWSVDRWGTKWNAYDTSLEEPDTVRFDTAWATPFPVMQQLARKYPDLVFQVFFADEDLGNNCGGYKFENGELVGEFIPEKGMKSLKFACEIKGYDFGEQVLNSFNYYSLDEIKEIKEEIVELMMDGCTSQMVDELELEREDSKGKLEYLLSLAVEYELYEDASHLKEMLT